MNVFIYENRKNLLVAGGWIRLPCSDVVGFEQNESFSSQFLRAVFHLSCSKSATAPYGDLVYETTKILSVLINCSNRN